MAEVAAPRRNLGLGQRVRTAGVPQQLDELEQQVLAVHGSELVQEHEVDDLRVSRL